MQVYAHVMLGHKSFLYPLGYAADRRLLYYNSVYKYGVHPTADFKKILIAELLSPAASTCDAAAVNIREPKS